MFSKFMNKMVFANLASFDEGKITIMGVGAVIISSPVLPGLFLDFYKISKKKAFGIFYDAGLNHGRLIGKVSSERFGVDKQKFSDQMADSSNMMGLGRMEVARYDPFKGEATVRIIDSTMAREVLKLNGKTKFPVDWFFCGTMVGVFESAFKGKKFECKEVRCLAMGDPHCEFVLKPK